jgi:RHH-type transcriptional regulator, rel operon repressor / antitoxin RelB
VYYNYHKTNTMPITVRLGDDIEQRLEALARLTGRTKTYYIREALEEKLTEMEEIYMAERRLEQPEGPRWSLDQLERGDDLEG